MSIENRSPASARELISAAEPAVIDVRSVEEFATGHVPGAYNLPLLFKGPLGMTPNTDFLAAMRRHFALDRQLVFV